MTDEQPKEEVPKQEDDVFAAAEVSEEQGVPEELPPEDDDEVEEDEVQISDESPKARLERMGKKEKADGRVLTVKSWGLTKLKTKDSNGQEIPPKLTQKSQKPYYPIKLVLRFEEDNLIEYYPNLKRYVNDGVISKTPKIERGGENAVSKLFQLAVPLMGLPEDEISDKAFYDFLVGKKVKIKMDSGKFQGREWFRNDIVEIMVE